MSTAIEALNNTINKLDLIDSCRFSMGQRRTHNGN